MFPRYLTIDVIEWTELSEMSIHLWAIIIQWLSMIYNWIISEKSKMISTWMIGTCVYIRMGTLRLESKNNILGIYR